MPEEGMGGPRSPEALRTWLDSLLTQIDHCEKEVKALSQAIQQIPRPVEDEQEGYMSIACEHLPLAERSLGTAHGLLFVAGDALDFAYPPNNPPTNPHSRAITPDA